jgi:dGTPase
MDDIISISVNNIYQSREVIEKEIVGYHIQTLLDKFITAYNNKYNGNASNYDALILKLLPEKHHYEKQICMRDCFISVISFLYWRTECFELFETINGKKRIN